jgi:cytoskeletal protein CcmA (bactofilin family)
VIVHEGRITGQIKVVPNVVNGCVKGPFILVAAAEFIRECVAEHLGQLPLVIVTGENT